MFYQENEKPLEVIYLNIQKNKLKIQSEHYGNIVINKKNDTTLDTGRGITIGDGLVPQIERFASKYAYTRMTLELFNTIIRTMNEKANKVTGNKLSIIVIAWV